MVGSGMGKFAQRIKKTIQGWTLNLDAYCPWYNFEKVSYRDGVAIEVSRRAPRPARQPMS